MAITPSYSGTVTNSDVISFTVFRDPTGGLVANAVVRLADGQEDQHEWVLSASAKAIIAQLLPEVRAAVGLIYGLQ
jgi:hypothetical protein